LPFDVFNMTELNLRRNSLAAKNVSESITNTKNSQEPLRDTLTPTYPLTPLPSITRTVIYIYILTSTILKNYAHAVVENSKQLRHLVTNKLIEETDNPDPRVRIRALELLGKISDVGLFADKTEITVTHQTTDDIKERLRSKLTKLINPTGHDNYDNSAETIEDAEIIEAEREVDAAFGIATKREVDAALGQNEEGYDD
jgi:hypothetical protein